MYALFEYKGKQYKAEKDALIQVDKIDAEEGAKVSAVVENSIRDKKVLVYKYKSKKDYHRLIGHRQEYTNIRVKDITL